MATKTATKTKPSRKEDVRGAEVRLATRTQAQIKAIKAQATKLKIPKKPVVKNMKIDLAATVQNIRKLDPKATLVDITIYLQRMGVEASIKEIAKVKTTKATAPAKKATKVKEIEIESSILDFVFDLALRKKYGKLTLLELQQLCEDEDGDLADEDTDLADENFAHAVEELKDLIHHFGEAKKVNQLKYEKGMVSMA